MLTNLFATTIDIGSQLKDVPFWPSEGLPSLLNNLVGIALVFAAVIAFFFLIYGGIRWITSSGDKEQLASAQKTITAALTGLIIIFAAWAILNLVKRFFGITGAPTAPGAPGTSGQPSQQYVWGDPDCPPETVACPESKRNQSWCAGNIRCICGNDLKYHVMEGAQKWCETTMDNHQVKCQNGVRVYDPTDSTCPGDN